MSSRRVSALHLHLQPLISGPCGRATSFKARHGRPSAARRHRGSQAWGTALRPARLQLPLLSRAPRRASPWLPPAQRWLPPLAGTREISFRRARWRPAACRRLPTWGAVGARARRLACRRLSQGTDLRRFPARWRATAGRRLPT